MATPCGECMLQPFQLRIDDDDDDIDDGMSAL